MKTLDEITRELNELRKEYEEKAEKENRYHIAKETDWHSNCTYEYKCYHFTEEEEENLRALAKEYLPLIGLGEN